MLHPEHSHSEKAARDCQANTSALGFAASLSVTSGVFA